MAQIQDLTIYAVDDDEEIIAPGYGGILDGEIVEATFSTDPDHPRPFLKRVFDQGESVIDFQKGSSVIGQLTVDVVDFPFEEDSQDQGFVTYLLATATGDTALIGVRAVFRVQNIDTGEMEVVFDGVIDTVLMPKMTTFRFNIRDARERERDMKLFTRNTGTCIFPYVGPKEGWGHTAEYTPATRTRYHLLDIPTIGGKGSMVFPRIAGLVAKYNRVANRPGIGSVWGFRFFDGVTNTYTEKKENLYVSSEFEELLRRYGQGAFSRSSGSGSQPGEPLYLFPNVIVEWSYTGTPGTYTAIGPMERILVGADDDGQPLINTFSFATRRIDGEDQRMIANIYIGFSQEQIDNGDVPDPALNPTVYLRVISNMPPEESVPLFLEETLGETLRKCYDGDYSTEGTFIPVRYDDDAVTGMERDTPVSLARINEPVSNGREWIQENLYRPAGYAPAIRSGKVYPIKYELPDPDTPLVQLDDTNTVSAGWQHGSSNIINQVTFEYQREIVPTALKTGYVKPQVQRVIIERDRLSDDSQRRHGTKPATYKPVTLRSLVTQSQVSQGVPTREEAPLVAAARSEELLRRYTNGAQIVSAVCFRDDDIDSLSEGDWIIGAWSWLADYVTRERGFNRLMQIVSIRRLEPHLREFLLVDAGPYDVPMTQPTVNSIVENDDGSATINVSDTPIDGKIQVQYALGEVEPDVNHGGWITVDFVDADGDVRTPPNFWPGVLVWARARGWADGRRASAWTNPISLRLSDKGLIRDVLLKIDTNPESDDYGKPIVAWDHLATALGIKIRYLVQDQGAVEPTPAELVETVEVDADLETTVLPVVLRQWQRVTIQVLAYTEFDGLNVGGDQTGVSSMIDVRRVEGHYVKPSVGELLERVGFLGELTLEILDSQLTIISIWFRTRLGTSGAWSDFEEDVAAPYGTTVRIVPGQSSAIGYEVYAYDHNGVEKLFKAGTVEFPFEGIPALLMRVTPTTGPDEDNYAYFDVAVADPAPQGLDSITLTAVGSPSPQVDAVDPVGINGAGVGTGTPTDDLDTTDVVTVTVSRDIASGSDGTVTFHAEAPERSFVEVVADVPKKTAPPTDLYDVTVDSVLQLADPGSDLQVAFTTDPASGWDHFRCYYGNTSHTNPLDMQFVGAIDDDTFDMNALLGWNLNSAGMQVRVFHVHVVVFDADDNPVGSSGDTSWPFNADPDT